MSELSVATTINPRFDHVTPIEATQSSVTITHRCHVFAELMAVARSGLVDVVLIADDFELVGLETLQQVLDAEGHGPKVAAISDVVDDRQRLIELGVPVASPTMTGSELVEWLRQAHRGIKRVAETPATFSPQDLQILEELDPDTPPERRKGRRAAPYDPATDLPESSGPAVIPQPPGEHDQHTVSYDSVLEERHDGSPSASVVPDSGRGASDAPASHDDDVTTLVQDTPRRATLTAVWGPIGAPGVTTVSVNLAVESALAGHRTLLIDADTYGAAVAVHLGLLDDNAAIAQACRAIEHRGITAMELADYAQRVTVHNAPLDVVTGLTRADRWPQLRAAAWEQLLEVARNGWDHIVVDCGFGLEQDEELSFDIPAPQRNATTIHAVQAADTVVAVGTGDPVGFVRFMKGIEHLTELTATPIVSVVNKVNSMSSGIGPKRQLADVWQRFGPKTALQHFLPWAPETTASALLEGKALAERAQKAEIRHAIRQILDSCLPVTTPSTSRSAQRKQAKGTWSLGRVVTHVKQRVSRTPQG